ncbi:MAG TPA: hypothetical protein DD490_04795 [Acidobacteria bacterium]|nr:hypothetical protein [Acidobacteriota bacterium]
MEARLLRHLLAGCPSCRQQLYNLGWDRARLTRLFDLPREGDRNSSRRPGGHDYSAAFANATRKFNEYFEHEHSVRDNSGLLLELAQLDRDDQIQRVSSCARFASPQLVREFIELSHAARYEDPACLFHFANLARLAAECCTAEAAGSQAKLSDLRAQGWRQYGNALRVAGRMTEAECAFNRAQAYCDEGTGDPPLRAWLFEQLASLRIFQRRFDEAVALADEASQIYRELSESGSVASPMIQKSIAQLLSGASEAAVHTLNRAIPVIDQEGDPHLLLAACHNMVRAYMEGGEPGKAFSIFCEARSLYRDFQDPLIALRASWQEGQLLRDLGHLRAAESSLLQARQGFSERGLLYEVAVVSLDLASVYLRLGETEKLRETVADMVPIFTSLGVDRDALAALLQLQQADQQDKAALELIRFLGARLEQLPKRE